MDLRRSYLIIPKLIEQPTWGGEYIVKSKNWHNNPQLKHVKIGQSYELFNGSNLSLLDHTGEQEFSGELTDPKEVGRNVISSPHSLPLTKLIQQSPAEVLGKQVFEQQGPIMHLLIKFTQALGNSFQLHIKDGTKHKTWKPKPESWYYFEPGLITLGVKPDTDWTNYQKTVTDLNAKILTLGQEVKTGKITFEKAQTEVKKLINEYNPWQYVNLLHAQKEQLIDLSPCGIHHSWEEDVNRYPLGNIVYELQLDVLDSESTIRNFDKGKMAKDGITRPLQIEDYFQFVDRSTHANDPLVYMKSTLPITDRENYTLNRLLRTKYYTLDKLDLTSSYASYTEKIDHFRHIFVKTGKVDVTTSSQSVTISAGHSCFVPAASHEYSVKNSMENSVVLISY